MFFFFGWYILFKNTFDFFFSSKWHEFLYCVLSFACFIICVGAKRFWVHIKSFMATSCERFSNNCECRIETLSNFSRLSLCVWGIVSNLKTFLILAPQNTPAAFSNDAPWCMSAGVAGQRERTLIVVKPDGVQRRLVGQIIQRFERRGFKMVGLKMLQVGFEWTHTVLFAPSLPPSQPWLAFFCKRCQRICCLTTTASWRRNPSTPICWITWHQGQSLLWWMRLCSHVHLHLLNDSESCSYSLMVYDATYSPAGMGGTQCDPVIAHNGGPH